MSERGYQGKDDKTYITSSRGCYALVSRKANTFCDSNEVVAGSLQFLDDVGDDDLTVKQRRMSVTYPNRIDRLIRTRFVL